MSATLPLDRSGDRIDILTIAIATTLPLTQLVQLRFVGTLFLQDLIAPILLLILLGTRAARLRLGQLSIFLLLIGVWLLGAIITDVARGTTFVDLSRGWSRIALFGVHTATLWLLSGGRLRILGPYLFGAGMSVILQAVFLPSDFAEADIWKFGVGSGLLLMIAGASTITAIRTALYGLVPSLMIAALGSYSLLRDSRSLFAICTLAAAYSVLSALTSRSPAISRRITPLTFTLFILVGIGAAQILVAIYGHLAAGGSLGLAAQLKYLQQTSGDASLLLAGRSETLVSIQAIKDSPILGHGSWAQDPYYVRIYFARLAEIGLPAPIDYYINTFGYLIPSHSYLFGSWVEAGVLGVPIWIWLLGVTTKALYKLLKEQQIASGLVSIAAFSLLWDVPFSPFGSSARFLVAAQVCVIISVLRSFNRKTVPGVAPERHHDGSLAIRPH